VTLAATSRRSRALATLATALAVGLGAVLAPLPAAAAPGSAAQAEKLVEQAANKLTVIDEQVHAAAVTVDEQKAAARAAEKKAAQADAALAELEPQLRAIAQTGFTGRQTQVAAFLTSDSADDLVQQMTTLDMIADHADAVVGLAAAAQDKAEAAHAAAMTAAKKAFAGLKELKKQKAQLQAKVDEYEAAFDRLTAQAQARVTARVAGPSLSRPSFASLGLDPKSAAATVIRTAMSKVGSPYVWGGTGPNGFDCSGFTGFAYASVGITLPHSSGAQAGLGTPVSRSELKPGDLVFFYSPISHVGLYIGNGMMVHARTFGQPVAVTSVDQAGYNMAVRLL
jgi:cell wall-associated NlpC family hydrolase